MALLLTGMGATSRQGVVRAIEQANHRWKIYSNEVTASGEVQVFNPIEAVDRAHAEDLMAFNAKQLADELGGGEVKILAVPLKGTATSKSTTTRKTTAVTKTSASTPGAALVAESTIPWGWILLGIGVLGGAYTLYKRKRGGRTRLPFASRR